MRQVVLVILTAFFLATVGCKEEKLDPGSKGAQSAPQKTRGEFEIRGEFEKRQFKEAVDKEVARRLAERDDMTSPGRTPTRPMPPLAPPGTRPRPVPPRVLPDKMPIAPPPEKLAEPEDTGPSVAPTAGDNSLVVTEFKLATAVDRSKREPVGITNSFVKDHGEVWAFAVLQNDSVVERKVAFVWKHGGQERWRSELPVGAKAARWRTWAHKHIPSPGRWVVEIVDESGLTLASQNFEVR